MIFLVLSILFVSGIVHVRVSTLALQTEQPEPTVSELEVSSNDDVLKSNLESRRAESLHDVRNHLLNFSKTTIISRRDIGWRWPTVPNLQWIGTPPHQVSHKPVTLYINFSYTCTCTYFYM